MAHSWQRIEDNQELDVCFFQPVRFLSLAEFEKQPISTKNKYRHNANQTTVKHLLRLLSKLHRIQSLHFHMYLCLCLVYNRFVSMVFIFRSYKDTLDKEKDMCSKMFRDLRDK